MKTKDIKKLRSVRDYKAAAWALTKAQFRSVFPIFLCSVFMSAAGVIVQTSLTSIAKELEKTNPLLALVITAVFVLMLWACIVFVATVLQAGQTLVAMRMVLEQPVSIKTLFAGFRQRYGRVVWVQFAKGLSVFGWSLLLVIPGIVKALSYAMTMQVFLENPQMTAREARYESARMMQGHKREYLLFVLSFFGWELLGCLFLGFSNVWTLPYRGTATVCFYQSIKDHQSPKGNLTTDAWE